MAAMLGLQTAPRRGDAELIALYRTSPWLRAVVSKISYKVAATPWRLFGVRGVNGSRREFVRHSVRYAGFDSHTKILRRLKQQKRLVEIEDHPLLDLLATANPAMTGLAAWRLTQAYLDIKGESFWAIERDPRTATPIEFWPIPPPWVQEVPDEKRDDFRIVVGSRNQALPPEDVIWMRDLNPEDPYGRGAGIGESLGDELDTDEYASKFIKTFFFNRAKPDLLVAIKGAKQEQLRRAKAEFDSQHRGFWRGHRTFWHGGEMEVKELQQKFVDMELSTLREFERDTVVSVFGVPPEILGIIENSNRATIDASDTLFGREVIWPRMEFLRAELQSRLVPQFDDRLVLAFESPVPEDREFRLQAIQAAPWAATRGEIRELQGLADRGDEDAVHVMPLNLITEDAPTGDGSVPGGMRALQSKALDENDAQRIANEVDPGPLEEALIAAAIAAIALHAPQAAREAGSDPEEIDLEHPRIQEHIEEQSSRAEMITATTAALVLGILRQAISDQATDAEIRRRIRDGTLSEGRLKNIARTEANRSANFARLEGITQSGVELKMWLTVRDEKVRDEHTRLEGVTVPTHAPFEIDGFEAMAPGGFGVARLDANCRCTIAAATPGVQADTDGIWKGFDEDLRQTESDFERGVKRAVREQLLAVFEALANAR